MMATHHMATIQRREALPLLVGDGILFIFALWVTLLVRYVEFPSLERFYSHLLPFSMLFGAWLFIFFIAGLYDRHTSVFRYRLPNLIITAQLVNVIIAALFFFFVPYFGITPKTNLVIYLAISSLLILGWRLYLFPRLGIRKQQLAILIGHGKEVSELAQEINGDHHHHLSFAAVIDTEKVVNPNDIQKEVLRHVGPGGVSVIITNTRHEKIELLLPLLYNLTFLHQPLTFVDIYQLYEDTFDRVPLSLLRHDWFLENLNQPTTALYDVAKRLIDVVGALILLVMVIVLCPLIFLAMKLEDSGNVFITQERMGQRGSRIKAYKFRTMERMEHGVWIGESTNKITWVGALLRKASVDEFPQCVNILKGEMSLIGPRSDIAALGERLEQSIPFYNIRYVVRPGITGWAQVRQQYRPGTISPQSIEETKRRLSYDLYYIKNRSLLLDIGIALRTISTIFSRFGIRLWGADAAHHHV